MKAKDSIRRSLLARTSLFATSVALSCAAFAQTQPQVTASSPAGASPPKDAQAIIITGSALPTTPDQGTVPVTVIDSTQIQKAGVSTNVLEILRKQLPAFAGRSSIGRPNPTNNHQLTASVS